MNPGVKRATQMVAQNPAAVAAALRILDQVQSPSQEQRIAREWMITAVEQRYPAASQAVEDAYLAAEEAGTEVDYVTVLLEAAGL